MALGAHSDQILVATISTGIKPVLIGIALGLGISAATVQIIVNMLFGVRALDLWMYAGTPLMLVLVATLACLIPARRAAQLNPVEVLRHR